MLKKHCELSFCTIAITLLSSPWLCSPLMNSSWRRLCFSCLNQPCLCFVFIFIYYFYTRRYNNICCVVSILMFILSNVRSFVHSFVLHFHTNIIAYWYAALDRTWLTNIKENGTVFVGWRFKDFALLLVVVLHPSLILFFVFFFFQFYFTTCY